MQPTNVTADRNQRLIIIEWQDGKSCQYPFAGLRALCPCVSCKGGHAHMGGPPDMTRFHAAKDDTLNLDNIQAIGSYAIQFFWSDGHNTGIYTWEYLRQACP